ncbi:MAG: hypothetical protein KF771_00005, partial [Burkholderiales bacterium]|nr:hypothetical protein [Burkholderiales bacterium]
TETEARCLNPLLADAKNGGITVPSAIDRAISQKIIERERRGGETTKSSFDVEIFLSEFCGNKKNYIASQFLSNGRRFARVAQKGIAEETVTETILAELEESWASRQASFHLIPGKEALSAINEQIQSHLKVSITPTAIIDAMKISEIPDELIKLIEDIDMFSSAKVV